MRSWGLDAYPTIKPFPSFKSKQVRKGYRVKGIGQKTTYGAGTLRWDSDSHLLRGSAPRPLYEGGHGTGEGHFPVPGKGGGAVIQPPSLPAAQLPDSGIGVRSFSPSGSPCDELRRARTPMTGSSLSACLPPEGRV